MSLEGSPLQESFAPKFSIWVSKEPRPATNQLVMVSHGNVTFQAEVNRVNHSIVTELRMISNDSDKANDELDRLKVQAAHALSTQVEQDKWDDYSENF